eukprot:scaffold83778_cov73-Cyclotella_meneghiniana.AAC.13
MQLQSTIALPLGSWHLAGVAGCGLRVAARLGLRASTYWAEGGLRPKMVTSNPQFSPLWRASKTHVTSFNMISVLVPTYRYNGRI